MLKAKAKVTEATKAAALVEKMTGIKPERSARTWRHSWSVVVGNTLLSWYEEDDTGEVSSVHTRRVDDIPDSQSDYFPGRYHDTIQSAIKSVTQQSRNDKSEAIVAVLGNFGSVSASLGWKACGGFVREAGFQVTRFVQQGKWPQFLSVQFILHDDDAIRMATGFIQGEIPAEILLDYLQDRDMQGTPNHKPYGRIRKDAEVVVGRLDRLLEMPQGKREVA